MPEQAQCVRGSLLWNSPGLYPIITYLPKQSRMCYAVVTRFICSYYQSNSTTSFATNVIDP